ncbi:hypothetical protein [Hydrocoleum sp. CS-953]|uniref:hypothetical protein n=1 Tax=Hydrocoleum sp. CS-953 TaxID=1671698 RepID=UPI00143CE098|nr:hypothetical protein [Hydrocoleum sp. CS-953]
MLIYIYLSSPLPRDAVVKFAKILSIFPSNYLPISPPMSRQKLLLPPEKSEN